VTETTTAVRSIETASAITCFNGVAFGTTRALTRAAGDRRTRLRGE
jgi:hypothetical protein